MAWYMQNSISFVINHIIFLINLNFMDNIWFDNWKSLIRIVVSAIICFAVLIILLRQSGKRALTKMSAFDLIITISIGSVFATIITSKDTTVADGVVALAILVIMQLVISWLEVRSQKIQQIVKATPSLLFYNGEFIEKDMKRERITHADILAAMRQSGLSDPSQAYLVILEADGKLSVIPQNNKSSELGTLEPVSGI